MGILPARLLRKRRCTVKSCKDRLWAKGLCHRHYLIEWRKTRPMCLRDACDQRSVARGLCVKHYQEEYRTTGPRCRVRGCPSASFARNLCVRHYHRWYQRVLREKKVGGLRDLKPSERIRPTF